MNRFPAQLALCLCLLISATSPIFATEPSEKQVSFKGADGTSLAGTLLLPPQAATAKVPALVLLAGSGPTDRNGNQPPLLTTDLLKQIAQGLANNGIATLRFDKRGMYANAAELPKDRSQYGDFFSWENFVGDSAAAYRFLRDQPEIDPARTGILGHSEGGLLALAASKILDSEAHPPAVLILLSTPGRPVDALITEQIQNLLKQQGASPEQTAFFLTANKHIIETIRTTGQVPLDVPAGLAALYPSYLGKFIHSQFAEDPPALATAFPRPVLVMIGADDQQVSPERDAQALDAALKKRPNDDHVLIIIADASHNLKIVPKPGDPAFAGPIAPDALTQLQTWASTKLAAHP